MISGATDRNPALIFGDQVLEFRELYDKVRYFRGKLGSSPRALTILKAAADPSFIAAFLATLEIKQPVAVFSEVWTKPEEEKKRALLGSACEFDWRSEEFAWSSSSEKSLHHPETTLILFTSGSSGEPKAVQLSRGNIEANISAVIQALEFDRAKEQTLFLSLSYSFGLLGQLLPALKQGIPTRFVESFVHAKALFDSGEARGMWSGVPSHWEGILRMTQASEGPIHGLTHIVSAGAYLSPDLRKRLHERFPSAILFNNYGLTEASPRVLTLSSREKDFFSEATGRPIGDWKMKLADDGELQMQGAQVMLGYLGDLKGTETKVSQGWLRSGDTAQESGGVYTIVGRMDELFNIGGERTSPTEIDSALKSIPSLSDAAVLIEEHPIYGAMITAFIVENPAAVSATSREISAAIAKTLPAVKMPREFYRIDALPRQPNGKLNRKGLLLLKRPDRKLP